MGQLVIAAQPFHTVILTKYTNGLQLSNATIVLKTTQSIDICFDTNSKIVTIKYYIQRILPLKHFLNKFRLE